MTLTTPRALLVAALIVAAALLRHAKVTEDSNRYELRGGVLLDTRTGDIMRWKGQNDGWQVGRPGPTKKQ